MERKLLHPLPFAISNDERSPLLSTRRARSRMPPTESLALPRNCVTFPAPPMPKVYIKTYGCQMNERDSEQVLRDLLARGYERAAKEREADVILLNTCSVRD